jgi:hypothetical protein
VVAESVKMPTTDPSGKPIPAVGPGGVVNSIAFTLREMLQKGIRFPFSATPSVVAPLQSIAS